MGIQEGEQVALHKIKIMMGFNHPQQKGHKMLQYLHASNEALTSLPIHLENAEPLSGTEILKSQNFKI